MPLFFHNHRPHQIAPQSQVLQEMCKVHLCMSWYKDLVILFGVLFNFWRENVIISAQYEKQKTKTAKQTIDIKGWIQLKPLTYCYMYVAPCQLGASGPTTFKLLIWKWSCMWSLGQLSDFCWAHFAHMVTPTQRHLNVGVLICKLNIPEFCLYERETMKTRTQWAFPPHP